MFQDEVLAACGFQRGVDGFPIDRAMAHIGPAVFIGILALGGDVFDMGRRDAPCIAVDPCQGVRPATDHPSHVQLNLKVRPTFQDRGLRDRAIRLGYEFKIMVVPAKAQTRRAQGRARFFQPCAKCTPASRIFGAIFGHQVRHINTFNPQGLGHFQRPSRGVFDLGQAEMPRLHRQSRSLEGRCGRGQRCRRVIKPAETFGARQANGCQHLGGGVQRREIARGV